MTGPKSRPEKNAADQREDISMRTRLGLSLAAAALTLALPAVRAQNSNPAIDSHVAAATKAAKSALSGALGLCSTATPKPSVDFMENYNKMKQKPPLEPMQV